MLSREINDDIGRGFVEIQRWVDDEHTQNEALSGERDSLAVRVKSLEAQVAGLETECTALRSDVQTLRSAWAVLEEKVQTEWELSNSIGLATWEALEALEGAVVQLSVVPPREASSADRDRHHLGAPTVHWEVCLPVARAYGDHCAKVAWSTTLASLDKAGCAHMDALAAQYIVVATAEEADAVQRRTQKVSKVLL